VSVMFSQVYLSRCQVINSMLLG